MAIHHWNHDSVVISHRAVCWQVLPREGFNIARRHLEIESCFRCSLPQRRVHEWSHCSSSTF